MGGSLPLASASLNSPDFIRQESSATPSHFIMDFCLFEPYLFFVENVLYGLQLLPFSMTTNLNCITVLLFFILFFLFSQKSPFNPFNSHSSDRKSTRLNSSH